MKNKLLTLSLLLSIAWIISQTPGCTTSAQRTAVNTIGTVETAATAAVDGYFSLVVQGKAPTNGVPAVSRAYNSLQQAVKLALDVSQQNTNALAPASLTQELTDLQNLVIQAKVK
jgi:hypothetical protein